MNPRLEYVSARVPPKTKIRKMRKTLNHIQKCLEQIGGWGCDLVARQHPELGNRFRLRLRLRCVRACVRSCAGARRFGCGWGRPGFMIQGSRRPPSVRPGPCALRPKTTPLCESLQIAAKSLLIDSKSFPVASRCFSLLPAAFLLLPAAFRLKKRKSRCLPPGAVGPAWCAVNLCKSLLIAAKSLLIDSKSFPVASRCFSLLPAAFPLLLAAFKLK